MCQNLKCRRRNNNKKTVKKVDILFFVDLYTQFDRRDDMKHMLDHRFTSFHS